MPRRLVAVHAHPDDESLTMGGTLARYAALGDTVTVVTATLGEQGEVMDPLHLGLTAEFADQLGGYRYRELQDACAALGVQSVQLGGVGAFRDSGMVGTPSGQHVRALVQARPGGPEHDRAVGFLRALLNELRPDVVLTYDADGGYGHPDHIAVHELVVAAAPSGRVCAVVRPTAAVAVALDDFSVPPGYRAPTSTDLPATVDRDDIVVPLDAVAVDRRAAGLAAHRTQLDVVPGGFALTNRVAQPLLPAEHYRILAGPPLPTGAADDLFAGL